MASAAAVVAWLLFGGLRGRRISAMGACIGAIVGLVAITPAAGVVTVGQSLFIGVFSALVSNLAVCSKNRTALDDTLDVFPCHYIGGICGMLLTAVFAREVGLWYGEGHTFLMHLLALGIVGALSFDGSWVIFKMTHALVGLQVSPKEELLGLDLSQHEETLDPAYEPSLSLNRRVMGIKKTRRILPGFAEPPIGLEPMTCSLRMSCSTS